MRGALGVGVGEHRLTPGGGRRAEAPAALRATIRHGASPRRPGSIAFDGAAGPQQIAGPLSRGCGKKRTALQKPSPRGASPRQAPAEPHAEDGLAPAAAAPSARSSPRAVAAARHRQRRGPGQRASRFRPVATRIITCRRRRGGRCPLQVAVARQRPQREELRIAVVAQVEHPREAAAGVVLLGPDPSGVLAALQPGDAPRHRRMVGLAGRHQAEQRPGGLRGARTARAHSLCSPACSCRSPRPSRRRGSGCDTASRPPCAPSGTRVHAGGVQGAQRRPGPVDVVDAPAAEPAAVGQLLALQIGERALSSADCRSARPAGPAC